METPMDQPELSGFSQVVSLGRRGKRTIYRAFDEEGDELVLMLFDPIDAEDSENLHFQWLGRLLLAEPIRHFVSIVTWESRKGRRVIAFKAPQGTPLRQITSDINGIAADFSFLLIRAILECCADHHELGLNLGDLAVEQVVISRQGPVIVPDFEFYLNQVSDTPEYDPELEMYRSTPGLRHRNDEGDVGHLGLVIKFLTLQIHDQGSLQSNSGNGSRELHSVLDDLITQMTNENVLQRPSASSIVKELEKFAPPKSQLLGATLDPVQQDDDVDEEIDFSQFPSNNQKSVTNTNHSSLVKKNTFTLVGITIALCSAAIFITTSINGRDATIAEDISTTQILPVETYVTPPGNVTNPETTVATTALSLAFENWLSIKENFLWSFGPEPIAVGNAVYVIASNQDLFPETAPIEKLTNLVLAQWNGQGWVSIQTTDLKDDSPGLLNVMRSPGGETIFLYSRCCVGHPLDPLQTVPINRIFTIRKGQLFDLINDENLVAINVPAFDVAFREDSLSGTICIEPKNNSSDFGTAGSCRKTRQITVRFNNDGSENIEHQDQLYEVGDTTPSIPPGSVVEEVSCNESWITIVAATIEENVQIGLDQNPGSRYLAGTICPSLAHTFSSGPYQGQVLYLIYYGPYFDHESGSAKCRELGKRTSSACYVKTLSNNPEDVNVGYGPNN